MKVDATGPHFNLKAVMKQTGLKADTLRAWERRYGLPTPERSQGGHRLYSQRDIRALKWLMARQHEGLSISRAVELWRQIESAGRDPLQVATPLATPGPTVPAPIEEGHTIAQLREDWISSCLLYDEQQAEQILAQAFSLYPPETVSLELIQKAVAQIGEGWYRGDVTVQQEHFCSELAVRRLEALVMSAPRPSRPGRILAACPSREHHVIGLLLLTYLLRRRGWDVVYLGANVPADRLETTIELAQPQLVILAAQQLHTAASLLDVAEALGRQGVPFAYGGLIFNILPELSARIPGHFLGESLELAPDTVERLMVFPQAMPEGDRFIPGLERRPSGPEHTVKELRLARDHFLVQRTLIEGSLARIVDHAELSQERLTMISRELGRNMVAALTLGDLAFVGTDLGWVEGLLENRQMALPLLGLYLRAYYRAARDHLDERGEPILEWLGIPFTKAVTKTGPGNIFVIGNNEIKVVLLNEETADETQSNCWLSSR